MNSTTEGLAKKTGTLEAVVELVERRGIKAGEEHMALFSNVLRHFASYLHTVIRLV